MTPHAMTLTRVNSDGSELWTCPVCGYSFVITWEPFHRTIITGGDPTAEHTACKGGMAMAASAEDRELRPWAEWMEGRDI